MNYDEAKTKFTALFQHKMSDDAMREFLSSLTLDENTSVYT